MSDQYFETSNKTMIQILLLHITTTTYVVDVCGCCNYYTCGYYYYSENVFDLRMYCTYLLTK